MKNTTSQKLRLGIFIVLGTLMLIAALYFIGNRQNLFSKNIKLNAQFTNVNGLQLGNNVRYSGIDVGTVHKINMQSDTIILVEMLIKESMGVHIKKDAVATIGSDGLVGNMIVNIIPQQSKLARVVSGDTIATYSRIGTDDMLTTLNVTNENASLLTADLLDITTQIMDGKGTLGMLITDSALARDLKLTIVELKKTSTGASRVIEQLGDYISTIESTESVANVLLTDSVSGEKMKLILDNLQQSSDEITQVTESLSGVLEGMKEGKGAVNYLTKDETLVKNIDSTMVNIKESTRKFNENMEALKSNFLFRGYFRKLERQKKRDERKAGEK
jgi:phospholipid/cholesterol/gamma-HCH transport system substrate-binding protein